MSAFPVKILPYAAAVAAFAAAVPLASLKLPASLPPACPPDPRIDLIVKTITAIHTDIEEITLPYPDLSVLEQNTSDIKDEIHLANEELEKLNLWASGQKLDPNTLPTRQSVDEILTLLRELKPPGDTVLLKYDPDQVDQWKRIVKELQRLKVPVKPELPQYYLLAEGKTAQLPEHGLRVTARTINRDGVSGVIFEHLIPNGTAAPLNPWNQLTYSNIGKIKIRGKEHSVQFMSMIERFGWFSNYTLLEIRPLSSAN